MTERPKVPGGSMGVLKARQRWADIRRAAETGDPADMRTAVSRFEGIGETVFCIGSRTEVPVAQPRFARDQTSARLLDMKTARFLELVDVGALPAPCTIHGERRWDVDELIAVRRVTSWAKRARDM